MMKGQIGVYTYSDCHIMSNSFVFYMLVGLYIHVTTHNKSKDIIRMVVPKTIETRLQYAGKGKR